MSQTNSHARPPAVARDAAPCQLLVEAVEDAGLFLLDPAGTITTWNTGARLLTGYSPADSIGQPLSLLDPPDDPASALLLHLALASGRHSAEGQRRRKDGTLFWATTTLTALVDPRGQHLGFAVVLRDTTELARILRLYSALSQVNQAIVWTSTREELLQKVCNVLVEEGGFRLAWIGWHDPATHRLVPVAVCGDTEEMLQKSAVFADDRPEGRGPGGMAFRTGQRQISNDTLHDPNLLPWRWACELQGYLAAASFPIRVQGEVRGILSVCAPAREFFHDREVALLEEAAVDVSFALDSFAREESRRQAEQAVRDVRGFADTMLESMPGILYFYDLAGRFLRWNRNFETVSGFSAEEITHLHPLDFFAGHDKKRVEERIAEVFERGESSVEAAFVARDGTTIPYFFTGRRVVYEGKLCLVGMGIDISDRQKAEDRLAESEQKYRELVEHANSIILRWNTEGRITFLNTFGQRFFGYSADEILGRHVLGTLVPLIEDSGRDLGQLMKEICAAPESFEQNANENMRRNGERVWVAWTNRVVRDSRGQAVEILSIGADITAQRLAEAEREKRHRAEAADRIKSAFLATMSHELRTPLNSIIGFTGIILQGLAGPLNAEQTRQLEMVRGSARHLLALVNDVLDISKIEAGQFVIGREPFDLRRSITRVLTTIRPQVEVKRLTVRVVLPDTLGEAIGDQRRFEQILLNLLSNAIKFTDHGEVGLTAELVPGTNGTQPAIRLHISDTGMGIKAEDIPTLFQPFKQIDTGLARVHEGTGLGLAICRRLAELMGGDIGVVSEWGKGSTFSVTLPLQGPVTDEIV
jgi:PAS domain S-box-containing protein